MQDSTQPDYTVELDQVFHGPLDLLLHLLREQEVEIHEIEISLVVDGYLAYLKNMQELDIELAGEFLVMASTLMAIKARSLLPREEVNLEEELDPRDELIARLIEYRRFKGAAGDLAERHHERQQLHPRGYREDTLKGTIERTIDLGDLTHWDLLTSYSRLMRETLQHRPQRVVNEARPMRYFVNRLATRMRDLRQTTLRELLDDLRTSGEPANRETLIGSFCALLELIKIGVVKVRQDEGEQDISIDISDDVGSDVEDLVRASRFDDEETEEVAPTSLPANGTGNPPSAPELN
ncbi:MAG: segregation/condensation protein A [Planctomycetota bacterium]